MRCIIITDLIALSPENRMNPGLSHCMAAHHEEARRFCAGLFEQDSFPKEVSLKRPKRPASERPLNAQAALVLIVVGLKRGQAVGIEHRIRCEANWPRLVQMHIRKLGANIEALERRPDKIGAHTAFLEV